MLRKKNNIHVLVYDCLHACVCMKLKTSREKQHAVPVIQLASPLLKSIKTLTQAPPHSHVHMLLLPWRFNDEEIGGEGAVSQQ